MVEPHLFCGPEFMLEVPSDLPLPIASSTVLELQSELYNLLTPRVRRKLHAALGASATALDTAVPPPPNEILFVEVDTVAPAPGSAVVSAERDNAYGGVKDETVNLTFRVTDSRVASELFLIGLRNPFITLPHRMRLNNRYGGGASKARNTPADILRKKEALRSRMNLDEDLWNLIQETVTAEWLLGLEKAYNKHEQEHGSKSEGTGALRESQRHERCVESLLHYCERNVHYIGVLDDEGKATPFLLAIGAFLKLGLSLHDALVHFARHHRRTIRALALFIARYTLPPEELEMFFAPSLTDEVVVACAEDQRVTCSMRQLSEDLLLHDEVCEAWPPTLHAFWIERAIKPMIQRVEAEYKRREEMRQIREGGAVEGNEGSNSGAGGRGGSTLGGSGTGVGVFGFRKITELHAYVREKQRVLVPQRVFSMLGKRERDDRDDEDSSGDEDDDDFLIKVRVEGGKDDSWTVSGHIDEKQVETRQQHSLRQRDSRRRKHQDSANSRPFVVTSAYRTILTLLGRTEPFDRHCEHYLQF